MESWEQGFLSRDQIGLAEHLDRRVDLLAGLRFPNLVAAANLKMSASLTALDAFRARRAWGLTEALGCAVARALAIDPLPAAWFDGRERLEVPAAPALGLSVEAGDAVRFAVIAGATRLPPAELAQRIATSTAAPQTPARTASLDRSAAPPLLRFRRLLRMRAQELVERFDYLLPPLQSRRFAGLAARQGNFCLHNLGTQRVEDFKGILRRPAVAALWVLAAREQAVETTAGTFANERRLPLVLVYSQALLEVDRACAFLGAIVSALEDPEAAFGEGS